MVGESETLQRVVNGGTDVRQGRLNGAVANRAKDEPHARAQGDEDEIEAGERPEGELISQRQMIAQAGDGVADHLRQRHLDGDVHEQQSDAERDSAGVLLEEGKHAEQIARTNPPGLFGVRGAGHVAGIEPGTARI